MSQSGLKTARLRLTRRGFIRLCILGVLGLAGGRGFMNSRALSLSRIEVRLNRLPSMFDGLKVGQITDIHAGPLVSQAQLRMGVDLLQSARPDLVALTGDFVSGATKILRTSYGGFKQRHYDYCLEELSKIRAPLGVFAVLGNHDFWSGTEVAEKIVAGLKSIGVRVLRNEAVSLERGTQRLYLVGVDDYWEGSYNLAQSLRGISEDSCRILLSHNPDVNEDIDLSRSRVDCIISGHTHGGQIVLPLIGAPYLPSPFGQKYRAGLVSDGQRRTYVSRGLGVFFVPVRLNCPPEVTLLTFRKGPATPL